MFSAQAVQQVERRIATVRKRTGEELLVVTVPSVPGASAPNVVSQEAERIALQRGACAVIYVDRGDRRDWIVARPEIWFPRKSVSAIRTRMEHAFRLHDYDAGLSGAVGAILGIYRTQAPATVSVTKTAPRFDLYGWLIATVLAYLVIRGSLREGAFSSGDKS